MINNPEFKRNILLELSVQRLIAVPVLLGLIFYVAMQNDSSGAIVTPSLKAFLSL